ncbi:anthranilate synthase family protein [Streptomyces sp. AM8-1-1]|uniref:anthranilate synthase family protein n=1 Tax=Streptomyces sp. AM8-1-1 TaxID=3075825 RepID=UPI0028C4966C|nr:anthranilate synthase family protein [Streptomyces sp. AM8-1-1]WNO74825.1 anthranilate synthase family protein [Streptomyces sp. AM8-1-1]
MTSLDELAASGRAFAVLHRPESDRPDTVDLLLGDFTEAGTTAGLPVVDDGAPDRHETLVLLPYRVIGERGYDHHDDGEPLLAMNIREQSRLPVDEVLDQVLAWPIELAADEGTFDLDDEAYGDLVRRVLAEEIGHGSGANFVLKRTYLTEIPDWSVRTALAFWGRLLRGEPGAYWTFLVHTGERTFIGASPERHVSLDGGVAVMNPISGTYRYPDGGASTAGLLEFLADSKETNELYMVLDEELKMMSRVCDDVRVVGPRLKEMAHLAHTEYRIVGRSDRDVREILHETLLAPTVTGSPVQSACRVIAKIEPAGRGYYAGVAALIGRDAAGARRMDSAIMIRTADVDARGRMRIGVGATLVRDSEPAKEAAETAAKAAGLLDALHRIARRRRPAGHNEHPQIRAALAERNRPLSDFWLAPATPRPADRGRLLILDAEDTFTAMGALQLRSLGFDVTVRRFDEPHRLTGYDLVVLGPGPGDPREENHRKIAYLRAVTGSLLNLRVPFVSVCLSHQVLCGLLGLPLRKLDFPNQGVRRTVDLFGTEEQVYYYNTFAAHTDSDLLESPLVADYVDVARDPATGEVHALRGPGFTSVQFHPESVMTRHGLAILDNLVTGALAPVPHRVELTA